jgi:hypothetical protein
MTFLLLSSGRRERATGTDPRPDAFASRHRNLRAEMRGEEGHAPAEAGGRIRIGGDAAHEGA